MSGVPLHYVDVQAFCYATEDEVRVERALRTFLPEEYPIERAENVGFHGDPIVVLSARVENADDVRHVLTRLEELPDLDGVLDELDTRVTEDCELYLYLDKQAALSGGVDLGAGLSVRGKVEAYPAKKEAAIENVRAAFEDH
ncbi:RNA-binding protein [Halomarina oriensis]|uniref:RNA-binding protein n=1 Tax=Halomarina oriensis TaxID=671145 RepID=A0A6B0GGG3_9EURY|nr:RNA-binding protein [Halomarina oriensis]MWG33912.1 RNA-binding protein [Halomarina oriensis]